MNLLDPGGGSIFFMRFLAKPNLYASIQAF